MRSAHTGSSSSDAGRGDEDDRAGRGHRPPGGRLRRALVALLVAGAAVACGPAATEGPAVSAPPTLASASPSTASPSPSPSPTPPEASPTPTAAPAPPATTAPAPGTDQKAPSTAPATKAAPKPAPKPTTKAPAPPTQPVAAECEIVSNAGNCYNAGQFCRKADIGRSTHAGNGRMIHCRQDGSQARWGY
ncbi:hypothetical protein [Streptomyces xanthophaeus]|uniref:hypothetical protein n=1 Tax=Streptomyces xanthophaeus TaxID=67385 RepID=UPI00371881FF